MCILSFVIRFEYFFFDTVRNVDGDKGTYLKNKCSNRTANECILASQAAVDFPRGKSRDDFAAMHSDEPDVPESAELRWSRFRIAIVAKAELLTTSLGNETSKITRDALLQPGLRDIAAIVTTELRKRNHQFWKKQFGGEARLGDHRALSENPREL